MREALEALMQPGELPTLADLVRSLPWHHEAACADLPGEWWFPPPGPVGRLERERGAEALAVCESCPVREPCLAYAVEEGVEGIWGGSTTAERRAMISAA